MVASLRKIFGSIDIGSLTAHLARKPKPGLPDNVVDAESVQINDLNDLDELISQKDSDLAEAKAQLKRLTGNTDGSIASKVTVPERPLPPRPKELVVEPTDLAAGADIEAPLADVPPLPLAGVEALSPKPPLELKLQTIKDTDDVKDALQVASASAEPPVPLGRLPDHIKVDVAVSKPGEAGQAVPAVETKEKKAEAPVDMMSQLFSNEEEEVNPLAGLLASLPDATAQEILDEGLEIDAMLLEWHRNVANLLSHHHGHSGN